MTRAAPFTDWTAPPQKWTLGGRVTSADALHSYGSLWFSQSHQQWLFSEMQVSDEQVGALLKDSHH